MFTATALPLALAATLASSVSAHYQPPSMHGHVARSHHSHRSFFPAAAQLKRRASRHARRAADPEDLMPGSLTTAEGCTDFYHVTKGEWCLKVVDQYPDLSLERFYTLNPEIDAECKNLWASYSVCVADTTTSSSSAPSTSAAAAAAKLDVATSATTTTSSKAAATTTTTTSEQKALKTAVKIAAAVTTTTTTSVKPTTTTTTSAPAATSSAASTEEDEEDDDDDWVCDDEDEEESSTSSSAAWTSSYVAPTTTKAYVASTTTTSAYVAPTTTTTSQWTTTTTTTSQAAASTKVADTSSANVLAASGVTGFAGTNENAILSWYNTNSGQDSTNGNSWCYFPYSNTVPGFAPSLKTMLNNFGGDAMAARKAYCGLEAEITTADGKTVTLYVADAFDDTWVRTPASLDIIHGAFNELWGSSTDNKNDVFTGASWKFTGRRDSRWAFNSKTSLT
ncbi:hypothetical protein JCM8547_003623 [Rhodosporidiobolus lusitaniae]